MKYPVPETIEKKIFIGLPGIKDSKFLTLPVSGRILTNGLVPKQQKTYKIYTYNFTDCGHNQNTVMVIVAIHIASPKKEKSSGGKKYLLNDLTFVMVRDVSESQPSHCVMSLARRRQSQ